MSFGIGETCSIACALLWAIVTISLKRAGEIVPPFELNLFKNLGMALLLIPPILLFEGNDWTRFTSREVGILVGSGIVGVCVADWLLLASLNLLGAGRNAILDCLYSPFVMLLAWFYLDEELTLSRSAGAGLVVFGILVATLPNRHSEKVKNLPHGIAYGVGAMVAMAVAIVMAKPVLEKAPFFTAMELRMLAGVGAGIFGLASVGKLRVFAHCSTSAEFPHFRVWVGICLPAFFAMCLWVQGYRLIDASVASILNQTSTFFILFLAAVFLDERLTSAKLLGALLAFGGVTAIVIL